MSLSTVPFVLRIFIRSAGFALIVLFLVCPANSQNAGQVSSNNSASAPSADPLVFTEEDREKGLKYLEETSELFFKEISELTPAQLNFRESPDRWSIAEAAEHIIIAEKTILSLIEKKVVTAPPPAGKDNFRLQDQAIWMAITNRNTKFSAPEPVQPKGEMRSKAAILKEFRETRGRTSSFLKNTGVDLRNRFGTLPVIGTIDGFQWFIFINSHCYRHLEQIKEIRSDPKFPAR
ncbi:MAG: DinB family protein [Pyrinomonadaceae bacterium]